MDKQKYVMMETIFPVMGVVQHVKLNQHGFVVQFLYN